MTKTGIVTLLLFKILLLNGFKVTLHYLYNVNKENIKSVPIIPGPFQLLGPFRLVNAPVEALKPRYLSSIKSDSGTRVCIQCIVNGPISVTDLFR